MGLYHRSMSVVPVLATAVAMMSLLAVAPAFAQSGSLSTQTGLDGTGAWYSGLTTMTWEVSQIGLNWHYKYTLDTDPDGGAISHLVIQTSGDLDSVSNPKAKIVGDDDYTDWSSNLVFGYYSSSNGNPGMPGSYDPEGMWGLKFNSVSDVLGSSARNVIFEFDSNRAPMWGDFYSKDGNAGGEGTNAVWNRGFGGPGDTNRILVPDTETAIPEWNSLALAATGILGLAGVRPRARR